MTNWKTLIEDAFAVTGDTWADVVSSTLSEGQLLTPFDDSWGGTEGEPFTLWTTNRVYFPVCYDGSEWCGSVARNPDGKRTNHKGGG